jgi:hypothetical protein
MKRLGLIAIVVAALAYCRPGPVFPADNFHLDFSTFLGGDGVDVGWGIALDAEGNAYIAGHTLSSDFPLAAAYQSTKDWDEDACISKFSSLGTALVYSTYLGGTLTDRAYAVAVDAQFAPSVTGETYSCNFPVLNAFQSTCSGNGDGFVTRLTSTGSWLISSSFLGGDGSDIAYGIAVDLPGYTYLAGKTNSVDFPTRGAYQASRAGGYDCFVTQLTYPGSSLYYSSYLGGGSNDVAAGIAVNAAEAFIAGTTESSDFPLVNEYQGNNAGDSAFVAKFSVSGSNLQYSTYLGGSGADWGAGIFVDSCKCAYVVGATFSSDFPTFNPYQASRAGGYDAFVTCLGSPGFTLLYSTYLGGGNNDFGLGVAAYGDYSEAFVCGATKSSDFPVVSSYQATCNGGEPYGDAFYTHLIPDGDQMRIYRSTYLGGSSDELARGIALDWNGSCVWLTGETNSENFPVRLPYQNTHGGGVTDAFVSRLGWGAVTARNQYHTDFDGDGTSDIAVWRAANGLWAVKDLTRFYLGTTGDQAVPADFNGDGTTEGAVYRGSDGRWAVRDLTRVWFGNICSRPLPADYDGDGSADCGLFNYDTGLWAVRDITRFYLGQSGDIPASGYFNDDSVWDPAIFRPATGLWSIQGITRCYFGQTADSAVPGDYTGDGVFEAGVFRPSSGLWAILNTTRVYLGLGTDSPCPADYDGSGRDAAGIYRFSEGLWSVPGITRSYFGGTGDMPVTR